MSTALGAWFSAFAFTQAVEIPLYVAALRLLRPPADRPAWLSRGGAQALVAFGASMITHPIVWFVIPLIPHRSYEVMVVRCEAFAVVAEAVYLTQLGAFPMRRSLWISLLANAASATLGLTCRHYLGWP